MKRRNIIILTILALLLISCNTALYRDDYPLDYSSDRVIKDIFNASEFELSRTKNIRATTNNLDSIKISWDAIPYATQYEIDRIEIPAEKKGVRYIYPSITITENDWNSYEMLNAPLTEFKDENVKNNYVYYYRIRPFNVDSLVYGKYSETISSNILGKVVGLTASKAEDNRIIKLEWEPALGASNYRIEGVMSGGEETINLLINDTSTYNFDTKMQNPGRTWIFTVSAVSEINNTSKKSNKAKGYTKAIGAPNAPESFEATSRLENLTLSWKLHEEANTHYFINRKNLSDNTISSLIKDQTIIGNPLASIQGFKIGEGNIVTYEDKSAVKGNEYEYSIFCYQEVNGKILYSVETTATGSILSVPNNIRIERTNDNKIMLLSDNPVGFDSFTGEYKYNITNIKYLEPVITAPIYALQVNQTLLTMSDKTQIITEDQKAVKLEFEAYPTSFDFTICLADETIKATKSINVGSSNEVKAKATSNKFITNTTANERGVYPVKLDWNKNKDTVKYYIYRSISGENTYQYLDETPSTTYLDDKELKIGKKYDYSIIGLTKNNKLLQASNAVVGYGCLTDSTYVQLVDHYGTHLWEYSDDRPAIRDYVNAGGTGSLGSATINGKVGGTLAYNAKMQGIGGYITFTYNDFAEFSWLIINGQYNITSNASQNGSFGGELISTGMYPGSIDFSPIELKNGTGIGNLGVTQDNNGLGKTDVPMIGNYRANEYRNWSVED